MASRRAEITTSPDGVREFLSVGRTIILVTTGPDGLPDPVPMWNVVGPDGLPVMGTYAKSAKSQKVAKQVVMRLVPDRVVSRDHSKLGAGSAQ